MSAPLAENLARLLADRGWSVADLARHSAVDGRTIRGLLAGRKQPHARTLRRLADGLGVCPDEFFLDPAALLYRHFDRRTNPAVQEVVAAHPEVFDGWTEAEFDELHSRVGTGGALTREGALAAAKRMNQRRELVEKLAVLLETDQAEVIAGMIDLLYAKILRSASTTCTPPGSRG